MAPLPLIKIFAVLFKEVSKPLAARLKHQAAEHPTFRYHAMRIGRVWDGLTQRAEVWTRGGRVKELKPVTDSHALSVGADFFSQAFLLSTALALVIVEWYRSSIASATAAELKKQEKAIRVAAKEARLHTIETQLGDVMQRLERIESAHSAAQERGTGILAHLLNAALASGSLPQRHTERVVIGPEVPATVDETGAVSLGAPRQDLVASSQPAEAAVQLSDREVHYLQQLEEKLHHAAHALEQAEQHRTAPAPAPSNRGWFGWVGSLFRSAGSEARPSSAAAAASDEEDASSDSASQGGGRVTWRSLPAEVTPDEATDSDLAPTSTAQLQ